MEKYNYYEAVADDVREYLNDNYTREEIMERIEEDRDDFAQRLNDDLWTEDSVTGNASGSYTFNTWKAEENICHNLDLLGEAVDEFGGGTDVLKSGAEACDVTIRCYLLGQAIDVVLGEYEDGGGY